MKRYGVDIATTKDQAAALAAAQDAAAEAIKAMGDGVATWVTNVTAAIGADSQFEQGLTSAKDKAAFLTDQFKAGNIDVAQFTTAMQSLGVPLDQVALKGGSAEAVLAKLNAQFGGAAGEAAKTYAGTQERLKNATGDVGEKIGMIVLPALASMTEAMIPVVDGLGRGVDAIQAWLTEVAKMPEVKGFLDALGPAWDSFMAYLNSVWKVIQDSFGPALQELWTALKDLWDALQPAIEAFKDIFAALSAGGEDVDAFKLLIQYLAAEIRAIAVAIQLVAPFIKWLGEGFKIAAEVISPALSQISKAIGAFVAWAKDILQGFYEWFVGGSLWQELWTAVIDIAAKAIATLIGIFTTNLVAPITGILTALGTTIQAGWAAAWSGLSEAFLGLTSSIQSIVASVWDPLSAYLQTAFGNWGTWANNAMTSIGVAITTGMEKLSQALTNFMGVVEKGWTAFGQAFNTLMTGIATTVIGVVTAASGKLNEILGGMISAAQAAQRTIAGILASIAASIQSMTSQAAAAAGSAGTAITDAFTGAWNSVASAATNFYNWLVGGSLWPDLMDMLVNQTQAGMGEVKASFEKGLAGVVLNAPTIPELTAAMNLTALGAAGASPTQTTPTPAPSQTTSVTLPVTVQVDGATISRVIERRLIANRQLSAWRSA
jgi:phage-related protein